MLGSISVEVGDWESPAAWTQAWDWLQTARAPRGWDERRRWDGAGTDCIEPKEELCAPQCFGEV